MTQEIVRATLPAFVAWLEHRRPLGLVWENKSLSISDQNSTWILRWPLGHLPLLDTATTVIARSGRRVWTPDATELILRLVRRHELTDAASWDWLRDSHLAHQVANPAYSDPGRVTEAGRKLSALAQSRLIAADMQQLAAEASAELVSTINLRTGLDVAWRRRQLTGVTVDMGVLQAELSAALETRRASTQLLGIDLLDDSTDDAVHRIHCWLAEAGIAVLDRNGNRTLDSDAYRDAEVPDNVVAQARFEEFRRVRRVGSRLWKLLELKKATVEGVVHPLIHIQGAVTGRGSITRPALGNINRNLRHALVARPGFVLVGADLHAAEPSVAAILSGDGVLAADLQSADVYLTLARQVFGADADDSARQQAKACFLGILYGRGARSVARGLGISLAAAKSAIAAIKSRYPVLAAWSEDVVRKAAEGEEQFYPDGRPFPHLAPETAYRAVNYAVQGYASTVFYRMVAAVAAELGAEYLFLPVHDELVLEVPQLMAEHAVEVLSRRMYLHDGLVTMTADAHVSGRAWSK